MINKGNEKVRKSIRREGVKTRREGKESNGRDGGEKKRGGEL